VLFPIFSNFEVRIICSRDIPATGRRLGEKSDLAEAAAAWIAGLRPRMGWLVFGLKPGPDLIAHEASHVIYALQEHAGATFDEETFCYHLGHLVGRIHDFLGPAGKRVS
jgi:hypothetical protein